MRGEENAQEETAAQSPVSSLCSVITSSSHCPQRDLETAGGRGYDGAKNKTQGSGHPTLMTVLRIDRLGFGKAKGAESELIPN